MAESIRLVVDGRHRPRHAGTSRGAKRLQRRAHRRAARYLRANCRRRRRARGRASPARARSFCGGADINWMRASLDLSVDENVADAERMSDMFRAIDDCSKPVIARVHGAALGGGAGLCAVCRHRDRRRASGLRLHRGQARNHSGGDLAVRRWPRSARRTRARSFSPASGSTRAHAQTNRSRARRRAGGELDARGRRALLESFDAPGPSAVAPRSCSSGACSTTTYDESRAITTRAIARQRISPEGQEGSARIPRTPPGSFVDLARRS